MFLVFESPVISCFYQWDTQIIAYFAGWPDKIAGRRRSELKIV